MTRRALSVVVLFAASLMVGALAPIETRDPAPLTVHEWGTFTSVAAEDGTAVDWFTQAGPQDLPCFVHRLRWNIKASLWGSVRMETPVLYFYGPQDTTVNVSVGFRNGLVTEWFPRAAVTPAIVDTSTLRGGPWGSRIAWHNVKVSPRAAAELPTERGSSHYYAARLTDASPLQSGSEKEKFLFYRGVGRFAPPITATVGADGAIDVRKQSGEALGDVILFENRGGRIAYRIRHSPTRDQLSISQSELENRDLTLLGRELERILVAQGLYPKEASAMVETWRDSWFEEGTRLFYIAPKNFVDSILPLQVNPIPTEVVRVFVGRVELITPRTMQDVNEAIVRNDRSVFAKYGRFLEPITSRIAAATAPAQRATFDERLRAAYKSYYASLTPTVLCQ